jgi:hypothetical protein
MSNQDEIPVIEWNKIISPKQQALMFGGAAALMIIIAGFVAQKPITVWLISASMLLLFSIMNNIQSIVVPKYGEYLQQSLVAFVATFIALGGLSTLCSGISIFEAKPYRTIYIIILVTYFFFIGIIMLMKSFMNFMKSKDDKVR